MTGRARRDVFGTWLPRALAVAACVAMTPAGAEPLPGSEWEPVELAGEAFTPAAEIFLRFEADGRYFGNGGCNSFRGAFVTNGEAILFSPAASTMMACPDPILGQEHAFLRALDSVRGFAREGTRLVLQDASGGTLMALQQRDAD